MYYIGPTFVLETMCADINKKFSASVEVGRARVGLGSGSGRARVGLRSGSGRAEVGLVLGSG
jgi:hypothetical protein